MRHRSWIAGAALALTLTLPPAFAGQDQPQPDSSMERAGDALLIGVPVLALGLTFLINADEDAQAAAFDLDALRMNGSPRHDLGLALLRSGVTVYGLKFAVNEERPNGDPGSFPSGHSAITFAGAEFIRKEYGWKWGAPALAAATFTAWSRVDAREHYVHDVLAGALIGIVSNHDFGEFHGWRVSPQLWSPASGAARLVDAPQERAFAPTPGLRVELNFGGRAP